MTLPQLLMRNMLNLRISIRKHEVASRRRMEGVLTALFSAVLFAGCASIKPIEITTLESRMQMHEVAITRKAIIKGKPEAVFSFIADEDVLPKVLTGYGPLPAVIGTSENTGPWTVPGSARRIHLADGTTVREQITHYEPSTHFAYKVWDFGNPLIRSLAIGARGEWTFTPVPGGTLVTWTYTFSAKNAVTALPLSGITQILWRGYMDVCLENTKRLIASN